MTHPLLTPFLTLCLLPPALGMLVPHTAQAQAPSKKTQSASKEMVALIRQANDRYDKQDWDGALELYAKAYAIMPEPELLWRLGQTSERLDKIPEAIGHYDALVRSLPDAAVATKARVRAEALRATLPATLAVTSTPPGANIYLDSPDSSPVGSTPTTLTLTPGAHTVLLKRDGFQVTRRQVDLMGGATEELEVAMQPLEPLAAMDEQRLIVVEEEPSDPAPEFDATFWGGLTTGIGVATLVTGGVFSVLQASATDEANTYDKSSAQSPGQGRRDIVQLEDDAEGYHTAATALYITGGALSAVGLGLWFYGSMQEGGDEVETGALSFGINVDGSVKVHLRF